MSEVKSLLKKGIVWSFLDNILLKGITFLVTVWLARILTPEDFGIVGIMAIFITLGNALTEGGMGNSIIRDNASDSRDFNAVFFGNLGISLILYPLLYVVAPFIASYFEIDQITSLIRVYGLSFILTAFFSIQFSVLTKKMDFKTITLLNLPSVILGSIVGIVAALKGEGVWSLVYLQLSTLFFKVIFYWLFSTWKPSFIFSISILKKHFNFGYKLMFSSLLDVMIREVYSFIIGKKFSIQTLGYYNQARTSRNYPLQLISSVLGSVSYPFLSKFQESRNDFNRIYVSLIRSVFFVMTGIMMTLILLAKPLFLIVLTEKWLPAVPYFQLLCLAGILTPIHALNVNLFKIVNRTDIFLKLEIIKVIATVILIVIGVNWGIYGLLIAILANSILAIFINTYYGKLFVDYTTFNQLKDMVVVAAVAGLTFYCSYRFLKLLAFSSPYIEVFLGVIIFLISFVGLSALVKVPSYRELEILSKKLIRREV